ncbi:hypothetical protein KSB_77220 [Ktedonobacter robiniae]|uniref:Radical SAM core domain-containing protein n=1 Tax=Ktedonobacter robiniae TaxID=2778365 RepID=A0ABQ3V3W0_9CHLR|nr:hypothetical protein KSB_77220 [Ktedonobacter robiniae]
MYNPLQHRLGVKSPQAEEFPPVLQRVGNQDIDVHAPFVTTERVTYQANEVCNLACPGCYIGQWLEKDGRVYVQNARKVVPFERVVEHLEALGSGLKDLFLLGAEATMTPDLSRKILYHAYEKGLSLMSITNGAARPEILDRTFLLALKEQALEKLIISIDSMDAALHDRLRGKQGALQRTLESLDKYIQSGFPIKVQMTVWPQNYASILSSVQKLYEEHGVRRFAFHCGSLEGVPPDRDLFHLHPIAWRALVEMLYAFREVYSKEQEAITEFNIPLIAFTEEEMRRFVIGDEELADQYFAHVNAIEQGNHKPMPFIGCPAAGKANGYPNQVYLFANDGPNGEGELSTCIVLSNARPGMHYARYVPQTRAFQVNTDPATSQMQAIKESPYFCPALEGATGAGSDRILTEKGPLYFACRYLSTNQIPFLSGQFTPQDYFRYVRLYQTHMLSMIHKRHGRQEIDGANKALSS